MKIKNIKKKIIATHYTRRQALNKLQLDLHNFRRLCIYRGIHPKDPTTKERKRLIKRYKYKQDNDGNITNKEAILYKISDIEMLKNDRVLLDVLRLRTSYFRKIASAKATNNTTKIEELVASPPEIPFDIIIRDRYPTFDKALQDLDDCLNTMFLVSNCTLPGLVSDVQHKDVISVEMINEAKELCLQFLKYITHTNALSKTYITTKGIYYEAIIQHEKVMWLIPHENNNSKIEENDIEITQIYVSLYINMLKMINFRLYADKSMIYPPTFDRKIFLQDGGIDSITIHKNENISMIENIHNMQVDLLDEQEKNEYENKKTRIFENCTFFISKELPVNTFKFILTALNAKVGWDESTSPLSPFNEDCELITHQITEKKIKEDAKMGRVYVHPQWVVDSMNFDKMLDINNYLIGKEIPPHLCPFENYANGEYMPDYYKAITEENTIQKQNDDLKNTIALTEGVMSAKQKRILNTLQKKDKELENYNDSLKSKKEAIEKSKEIDAEECDDI